MFHSQTRTKCNTGRHDIIFPMFEFEMPGDINDLKKMEYELCEYLGFPPITEKTYADWQQYFGLASDYEMTAEEEGKMFDEFGATMITDSPEMTSRILEYE